MQNVTNKSSHSNKHKKLNDISIPLSLSLSPLGHLYLYEDLENSEMISPGIAEKIQSFFSVNESMGLLRLGLTQFNDSLPPSFAFWQRFSQLFITEICKHVDSDAKSVIPAIVIPHEEMSSLISQAPFIRGIEYLTESAIASLWQGLVSALRAEITAFDGNLSHYLSAYHTAWNTIGRVCFHLAENKNNQEYPFAFLATYTTGLSKNANTQHLPLGKALEEYAEKSQKSLLLSLLLPVHRAAEKSIFLKNLVDSGRIFKPLAWQASDAYQFLKDIPQFETAGVMVRVPNWWNVKTPPRPKINVKVGEKKASQVGMDAFNSKIDIRFINNMRWQHPPFSKF